MRGQYFKPMKSVDLRKSFGLNTPSLVKKNTPAIKKMIEIASRSLLEKSSINKTKKAVPRTKKNDGNTMCDNFKIS